MGSTDLEDKGLSVSSVAPGISQLPQPEPSSVPGVDTRGGSHAAPDTAGPGVLGILLLQGEGMKSSEKQ